MNSAPGIRRRENATTHVHALAFATTKVELGWRFGVVVLRFMIHPFPCCESGATTMASPARLPKQELGQIFSAIQKMTKIQHVVSRCPQALVPFV